MSKELQELYTEFQELYNFRYISGKQYHINHIDDWVELSGWNEDTTMLMIACYFDNMEIVKKCISLGANINKRNITGRSALFFAIVKYNSDYKVAELLLSLGADPNIKVRHIDDHTIFIPLIFYASINTTIIQLLLHYGAILNEFDKYKRFVLQKDISNFIRKKIISKRRWVTIKCVTLILSLHKRAVERVNHPDRLLEQGVFEI